MVIVCARWLGVSLLVALFAHKRIRQDWSVIRRNKFYFVIMGMFGFTIFNALFYFAAHSTTAINLGILQGSIPIFVLVGSFVFFKHKIGVFQALGVFFALTGVVLVTVKGDISILKSLDFASGDLLMLMACVLYAGYSLGLRKRPNIQSFSLFSLFTFCAFLASIPLVLIELQIGQLQLPTTKGWAIVGLITLLPSFLAQILFIHSVNNIGPARAGVFINLVPIFAAIMAVIILKEEFHWFHFWALLLVLGGIALSEYAKVDTMTQ